MTLDLAALWGQNVRAQRKLRGLSQRALGDLVGVTQAAVNRWEHGQTMPRPKMQIRIADALQMDPRVLFPLVSGAAA